MKQIITVILLTILTASAQAIEIKSKIALLTSNEVQKFLEVRCDQKNSGFCENLCANAASCEIPEIICEECVSQKSQMMYTVFNGVESIFKANIMNVEEAQLLNFLKTKKFMSIPHDTFLNMFTPQKKEQLKKEFEKLCLINVQSAVLLATIDEKNQADELVGVICQDTMGSVVLPVEMNANFSQQQAQNFWNKLNTEIGIRAEGLKLKMSEDIQLERHTTTETFAMKASDLPAQSLSSASLCKIAKIVNFADGTLNDMAEGYKDKCLRSQQPEVIEYAPTNKAKKKKSRKQGFSLAILLA